MVVYCFLDFVKNQSVQQRRPIQSPEMLDKNNATIQEASDIYALKKLSNGARVMLTMLCDRS